MRHLKQIGQAVGGYGLSRCAAVWLAAERLEAGLGPSSASVCRGAHACSGSVSAATQCLSE